MNSNITSFNLTDLAYWTSYNICVSAFTTIGKGEENCTIEKTEEYREYVCDYRTLIVPVVHDLYSCVLLLDFLLLHNFSHCYNLHSIFIVLDASMAFVF
jgi:hypothetical protein